MTNGEDIFEKYKRDSFEGDYLFISADEWQEIKEKLVQVAVVV